MKDGMIIEYLICRADLNVEIEFKVNSAIDTKCQQIGFSFIWNVSFYPKYK